MKKRLFVLCFLLGIMCAGCGNDVVSDESMIHIEESKEDITEKKDKEDIDQSVSEETETKEEEETSEETEDTEKIEESEDAESNLFAELTNREFYFASGAGGWRTVMHISKDGSFTGEYSDSDMGSVGEGYPNGTYYVSNFKGAFTKPVKVNEYTYSVGIAEIEYDREPGTEEIIDGILHCYSDAYGIVGANSVLIYLPGAPLSELPQEYLDWVRFDIQNIENGELPFYGIYNEKEQNGFSSYEVLDPIDEMMQEAKNTSDFLKTSLENDVLTQMDMNMKSKELYDIWDAALNRLWAELKNTLSGKDFENLLNEQRQWIKDKEKAIEEAAVDVQGGSMEPLVKNMTAAEMTEKRVYELYELVK